MKRYWFSDGLVEIALGLGFWLTGGVLAGLGLLPGLALKIIALPLAGLAVSAVLPWGIGRVRGRWWPFDEPLLGKNVGLRSQLWGAAVALPVLIALAFLSAQLGRYPLAPQPAMWISAAGLLFSVVPLALGFTTGVVRFYGLAIPLILAGGWLGMVTADLWLALLALWFGAGSVFLLSGTAVLLIFHRTQR